MDGAPRDRSQLNPSIDLSYRAIDLVDRFWIDFWID
ncbi:MAG: hypothetical protein ACI9P3_003530 [Bradyrhizobium sp.]|jgi:hypothetical protein